MFSIINSSLLFDHIQSVLSSIYDYHVLFCTPCLREQHQRVAAYASNSFYLAKLEHFMPMLGNFMTMLEHFMPMLEYFMTMLEYFMNA